MIKLRFITQHSPISWGIRMFTWSDFSHVELVLPEGYLGADEDGVKIRPFNYCKPSRCVIGTVGCSADVSQKVIEFAKSQIGKPYDYTSIIGFIMHRDWRERDSWFCSELVAASFEEGDYPLLDTEHMNRITPQDLLLSPLITLQEESV